MSQLKRVCFKWSFKNAEKNKAIVLNRVNKPEITMLEKVLRRGYKEMGLTNLSLAEMCFDADCEQLRQYEEKLTECE